MAALQLLVLEAANVFVGDDPSASAHLVLKNVKLPAMQKNYVDFMPGGGILGTEIDTHFQKLECTFSFAGWSPQTMSKVGIWSSASQQFSIYGMLRDRLTGAVQRIEAFLWGQLAKAAPDNFDRGTLNSVEYSIMGIYRYKLVIDKHEIYFWDMGTNELIIGGVDILADQNAALGVPASSSPLVEITSPVTGLVGQP